MKTISKRESRNIGAQDKWINQIVCRNYVLLEKIDHGSFGMIYKAKRQNEVVNSNNNIKSNNNNNGGQNQSERHYAAKIEENTHTSSSQDTLTREAKIMYDLNGEKGFPRLYYFLKTTNFSSMVTTLLDQSLEKLHERCKIFSLKTVLMLVDQMLTRIQYLHSKGYIHRDIKPDNFMIGREDDKKTIYLIDFGLSRSYRQKDNNHIQFREHVGLVGTTRYASVYSHLGFEQSRRDDLESLGYTWIYLLKGKLPWMNLQAKTKEEKNRLITKIKLNTTVQELCAGLPVEFQSFLNYVKNLSFTEEPNYAYFKKIFRTLFLKQKYEYDDVYDWIDDKTNTQANIIQKELSKMDSKGLKPNKPSNLDKRNMFIKFTTVNPNTATKKDVDEDSNSNKSFSSGNNNNKGSQNEETNEKTYKKQESEKKEFKRRGTRKSTGEFIKKDVPLEIKIFPEETTQNKRFHYNNDKFSSNLVYIENEQSVNESEINKINNVSFSTLTTKYRATNDIKSIQSKTSSKTIREVDENEKGKEERDSNNISAEEFPQQQSVYEMMRNLTRQTSAKRKLPKMVV